MSYAYIFEGRKPSAKRVLSEIRKAQEQGENLIEIYWGENSITLELSNGLWYGYGWIKNLGGSDIAMEINRTNRSKFVEDHFKFIHIG